MRPTSSGLSRPLRCATSPRRYASSSSGRKRPTAPVPKERMRALVSLYQQSDTFLTPSNLSKKIDEEFVYKFVMGSNVSSLEELTYRDLAAQYASLRAAPKIGDTRVMDTTLLAVPPKERISWSDDRNNRETMVQRALYGLDVQKRPGLEVLEEESERVRQQIIQPDAQSNMSS